MTTTLPRPDTEPPTLPEPRPARRIDLSATQLIASALAAITATVVGSLLGVTGTVIGAAVASVLTVTGNAVYGHSLRRTVPILRRSATYDSPPASRSGPEEVGPVRSPGWYRLAFGAVAIFAAVLAVVTGIELAAGRPLSDLVRGDHGSGTTLFDDQAAQRQPSRPTVPAATITKTVVPHVVITTPTITQTAPPVTKTVPPTTAPSTPAPTPTASATTSTAPASQPASP